MDAQLTASWLRQQGKLMGTLNDGFSLIASRVRLRWVHACSRQHHGDGSMIQTDGNMERRIEQSLLNLLVEL